MGLYEDRQATKARHKEYRERAKAGDFTAIRVGPFANVVETDDGAFVDVVVDVPKERQPLTAVASDDQITVQHALVSQGHLLRREREERQVLRLEVAALRDHLKQAEETRDAAQREATKQTLLKREIERQLDGMLAGGDCK